MKTVDLIGFDDFDADTIEEVKEKMRPLINKYNNMFDSESIQDFKVVNKTFKKDGGKDLHELVMTLDTVIGSFRVKKDGWDILSLVDEVETILERQLKERKEKILKQREGRNA